MLKMEDCSETQTGSQNIFKRRRKFVRSQRLRDPRLTPIHLQVNRSEPFEGTRNAYKINLD
ncbi:hypothetical protein AZE42_13965 [Rhizopogon vesiculosus]|uniref:Uncharacterized protein n=1 Tax=Rhizopogon vesiculosus TaxID=180088 RepID=A0A1J8Q355_9AGAM|nr:hypothetical protein AZE42_13965 [Rhizopogon vesiculosus]